VIAIQCYYILKYLGLAEKSKRPMPNEEPRATQSASDQIFSQIEQNLEAGGVRDVWQNLRKELTEGGIGNVRTYLDAEYQRRKGIIQSALDELTNQLKEVN